MKCISNEARPRISGISIASLIAEVDAMILFIGDIHGEFKALAAKVISNQTRDAHLIQVGDFGVGFLAPEQEQMLEVVNRFLVANNNMLYVVRGNHDNPAYFTNTSPFSNITFVSDYTLLKLNNQNILCVGGAISVDRTARVPGKTFWADERFTFNNDKLFSTLDGVDRLDTVVTHNAPSEFWPYQFDYIVQYYARRDPHLLEDLKVERAEISKLLQALVAQNLKPQQWLHGHYHTSMPGHWNGIDCRALGIIEFVPYSGRDW